MLRHLDIRDLLIIDRLELRFQPGLNVLTGETGAGKSILLDALGFVLGWRGRADLVRAGASQGEVVAVFDLGPDHPAHGVLEEAGLPGGPRADPAPGERRRRAQDGLGERPPRLGRGAARAVGRVGGTARATGRPGASGPAQPSGDAG
jgi:energy-coupling factor transporter ATP-binding protein EcfA2